MTFLRDGFRNLVANLGTPRDKAAAGHFVAPAYAPQTWVATYRASALARKIVDIPADDATREWRAWQAEAEQISAIEAEEDRLGLRGKVRDALRASRLLGGAALLIGADTDDPAEPLRLDRIGRGGLSYVGLIPREHLSPAPAVRDPASPWLGQPEWWSLRGDTSMRLHPSRLVLLRGAALPGWSDGYATDGAWGDSVLAGCSDSLRNYIAAAANASALVHEAKVDVLKIDGLARQLAAGGAAEEALRARLALLATLKGTNGLMALDKEDDYSSKSASFGGLPDLLSRFALNLSADADIPMTRLFGQSPAGLTASGESDTRNYYDKVRAHQAMDLGPALATLDEALIRSALGSRPPEAHYNWRTLWQPEAKDVAENGRMIAETFAKLREMDVGLPEEALAGGVVNALTEAGCAPGFEALVAEFYQGGSGADDDAVL